MKVLTSVQMKELDRRTIEEYETPGLLLMERASLSVFQTGVQMMRLYQLTHVLFLCGPGNNGGDGLAAARHFDADNLPVTVLLLEKPENLKGDSLTNYQMAVKREIPILSSVKDLSTAHLPEPDRLLIIDSLFGTGLKRNVNEAYLEAIEWINRHKSPVLAVDIPSGIDGDTGTVRGHAVKAWETIAFQLPKVGNVCYPGAAYNGKLTIAPMGIPKILIESTPCEAWWMNQEEIAEILPLRQRDAHKGHFGSLLIIAGVQGYTGASVLAARASLRSGTGLVKIAVRESLNPIYETLIPEAITVSIPEEGTGFTDEGRKRLRHEWEKASAVIAGPGWGTGQDWVPILKELALECPNPLILDADALNLLGANPHWISKRKNPLIMTPHPGEFSRLTGHTTENINQNRIRTARESAQAWNAVVVLKGAGTVIASPQGGVLINSTGNPGMAKPGSGDVLAGIIGALSAQGIDAYKAAAAGCWIHGRAGDREADEKGLIGLTAGDLIEALPGAYTDLMKAKGEVQ